MKVLVVGIGSMGLNHIKVLTQLKKENLVTEIYAVDIDKQRLDIAKNQGADLVFTDFHEAIPRKPDLGIIALPTRLHYTVTNELMDHMDLLVEKPITEKLGEALDLYRKSKTLGRRVFVGYIERFNPVYKALINDIGNEKPMYVETIRIGKLRGNPQSYGNVLLDLGIHDIDLALNMVNEDKVKVLGNVLRGDPISTAWLMLSIGGSIHVLHVSWDYEFRIRKMHVTLRNRYYEADLLNKVLIRNGTKHMIESTDQLRQELMHVINVLRGIERPIIDITDGIRALAIIDGILMNKSIIDLDELLM
ncbi:oxidoreductase domain protein [Vulcanisaeta moutnovskia 768-28]|uniref:Oxidoreductase domain protein n=1 Tax=Vulcanisaeta moutnovskia (strain 768-28) TaxID=985053 RepID=F0QUD2_VULM7|nr:Gfo/Idh/MocA family oxidoreductase [Vulcanisaeta moutnovskia]ADY01841.1 oxidoreductase domain protein [Vulcanisaeta moutnovskia 768-28]